MPRKAATTSGQVVAEVRTTVTVPKQATGSLASKPATKARTRTRLPATAGQMQPRTATRSHHKMAAGGRRRQAALPVQQQAMAPAAPTRRR